VPTPGGASVAQIKYPFQLQSVFPFRTHHPTCAKTVPVFRSGVGAHDTPHPPPATDALRGLSASYKPTNQCPLITVSSTRRRMCRRQEAHRSLKSSTPFNSNPFFHSEPTTQPAPKSPPVLRSGVSAHDTPHPPPATDALRGLSASYKPTNQWPLITVRSTGRRMCRRQEAHRSLKSSTPFNPNPFFNPKPTTQPALKTPPVLRSGVSAHDTPHPPPATDARRHNPGYRLPPLEGPPGRPVHPDDRQP
jgi:hypothetical protein